MDLKRRTVGLTLPFIFGDASAIYCGTEFYQCNDALAFAGVAVFVILSFLCFLVVRNSAKEADGTTSPLLPVICIFLCGIFCGLAASFPLADPFPHAKDFFLSDARDALNRPIREAGFRKPSSEALVHALLTGEKSLLDAGTKAAFRDSGSSHILALSGFHLGIIYLILSKAFSVVGRSRRAVTAKSVAICIVTGIYSILTGGSPSIVRAFLFILLNEISGLSLRKPSGEGLLAAALMIQLTISPRTITTVSFQLSYLAMTGIVFIFPTMKGWWPARKGILKRIWETCALAISCQIFTAPAVWVCFGTFPTYFLLTNLIATPLVTMIMFLSLAVTVLSAAGTCPDILITADEKLIDALMFCLETISSL